VNANTQIPYRHDSPQTLGILLVNLGTPDSPSPRDVRRYLREFLWDPRVVELPRLLWWPLLHLVILNVRPVRSARAYARIWNAEGSPLLSISRKQQTALQERLAQSLACPVHVALAMRYGRPSISAGLQELRARQARRVLVLPLYPQYSATTTASVFDAVAASLRRERWLPELRFVNQYHDDEGYLAALAESVREHWARHGRAQRLILSFHGIPRRYFLRGDPYYCQCHTTARLLAARLGLTDDQWMLTFQSRMGREPWLEPYTDQTLRTLPAQGVRRVQVLCPGFAADCLETLDEIALENREVFMDAGGESYEYIPCLNDRPKHIEALADLVTTHTLGWRPPPLERQAPQITARVDRAKADGAPY